MTYELKHNRPEAPHMKSWKVDGTDLDIYIQPGGCLEIRQTVSAEAETAGTVHICDIEALDAIVAKWKEARSNG